MAVGCNGNHRSRLFIGEAHFKGIDALLNKHAANHPRLGESVTATELQTFDRTADECVNCELKAMRFLNLMDDDAEVEDDYCSEVCRRIQSLKDRGVTIILGYDGTQIHTHALTMGRRYKRIQWNCPHDKSNYQDQTLPPIIRNFFTSASQMQQNGDRIHVTLAQPIVPFDKKAFYQGVVYNIRDAAQNSGYRLLAKRHFGPDRYPGYVHEQTGLEQEAAGAERQREFVFVKGNLPAGHAAENIRNKNFNVNGGMNRQYYVLNTDNESSDYDE